MAQTMTAFRSDAVRTPTNISINLRQLVGEVVGTCDNDTARAGRHIFPPSQTEESDIAQGPDATFLRLSAHSLGCIFNDRNPEWFRDRFGSSDIRCLPQQMWTDDAERLVVDNTLKLVEVVIERVRIHVAQHHLRPRSHNG